MRPIPFDSCEKASHFVHLKSSSIFFLKGPEGKPGKIGERGNPGQKVCQSTCSRLKCTFDYFLSICSLCTGARTRVANKQSGQ